MNRFPLLLALAMVLPQFAMAGTTTGTCTDYDLNQSKDPIYIPSWVDDTTDAILSIDHCDLDPSTVDGYSTTTLIEYSCGPDGKSLARTVVCPLGCKVNYPTDGSNWIGYTPGACVDPNAGTPLVVEPVKGKGKRR